MKNYSQQKKILIIKFGGLGDVILSLQAMSSIIQHHKLKKVLLTEKPYDDFFRYSKWFDQIITMKRSLFYFQDLFQIKRKFNPIVQRAKLYSKIPNTLFSEIPIQRSNNIDINILKSIIAGNFINIIKADHKKYISCFPEEKLSGNISRDSLYKLLNDSSRYVVYCEFKSIFNRMSFGIISKITPSIITELKNNDKQKIIFSKC